MQGFPSFCGVREVLSQNGVLAVSPGWLKTAESRRRREDQMLEVRIWDSKVGLRIQTSAENSYILCSASPRLRGSTDF